MRTFLLIAATALLALPAAAQVYKCPDGRGGSVIQQAPCVAGTGQAVDVRPASGKAPTPAYRRSRYMEDADESSKTAKPGANARQARMEELSERTVPAARAEMYGHRQRCAQTQTRLRDERDRYAQAPGGTARAAQVASEMTSHAAECEVRDRENKVTFDRLLKECALVDGCKTIRP